MNYLQRSFLFRFYSSRSDVEQILLLCGCFCAGLLGFRMLYTGKLLFGFLAWNLFLAFIPYAVSRRMCSSNKKSRAEFMLQMILWILFVPNAFYILTDLFHLDMNQNVPLWYDLAMLLSFAWAGLLLGITSVRHVEKLFESRFKKKFELLFIVPVMLLNALGIYIGRYLRFNSWDLVTNPLQLSRDMLYLFIHPLRNKLDWGMILCYSVLLTLIYLTIKKLSKGMQ